MNIVTVHRGGFTVEEFLRQIFPMGRTAFYAAVRRGEIRTVKIGSRTFVPASEVERLSRGESVVTSTTSDAADAKASA